MNNLIEIKNLNKLLFVEGGVKKTIFTSLSLTIPNKEKGTINSIVSPVGAGKTTLLKIISGIENYDSGSINFSDTVPSIKPLITETNSTLPWLNVKKNILIWLKSKNEKISDEKLSQFIDDVGLSNYEDYHPQNENSGFQFRIALARALAFDPKIVLIDDSFKNLDLDTRNEIYSMLKNVVDKYSVQIILATNNITEVIYLSNQIFLMTKNPAEIIFDLRNEPKFDDIQSMVASDSFKQISQEIESKYQASSGIALIHYSV